MSEYKKLYYILMNSITEAISEIEKMNYGMAKNFLLLAQMRAEEAFISYGEVNEEKEEKTVDNTDSE